MSHRWALTLAALSFASLSLGLSAAQACECHGPHRAPRPVVRRVRVSCGCHRLVRHVVGRRRVAVVAERAPPIVAAGYQVQTSERDTWSYRRFDDGASAYGWRGEAGAHVSATDRYGYLTWPGKHLGEASEDAGYGDEGYAASGYSSGGQAYDRRTYSRDTYVGEGYAAAEGGPCPCGAPPPAPPQGEQYYPPEPPVAGPSPEGAPDRYSNQGDPR